MEYRTDARIIYGRSIRERAEWLLQAHGPWAEAVALEAAHEPGAAAADRAFWASVATRVARQLHSPRVPDLPELTIGRRPLPERARARGAAEMRGYVKRAFRFPRVPPVTSAFADGAERR